jgi:phosphoribosylformimino-5-aminoimidazole carboxamide ribotide isomerase
MANAPRLVPVLDVKGGVVVRAVAGRREGYRPVVSTLTTSTEPAAVAAALRAAAGTTELYVADLDAITGGGRVSPAVAELLDGATGPVWLDAGFGPRHDVIDLPASPHLRPVVGFETCRTPDFLRDFTFSPCSQTLGFSIDLRGGELVGNWGAWGVGDRRDALGVARVAIGLGVRTLIVLDLARVGTGTGSGTEELLAAIRSEFPRVELIAGGGVRTWDDVDRLGALGADGVLVASALHDGALKHPRPAAPPPAPPPF